MSEEQQYISLKQLAQEFGLDRSNLRKYILARGFSFSKMRMPDSGNQLINVLTEEDAEQIRMLREQEGFGEPKVLDVNGGWFYVIQLVPELDSRRIKLGFASDPESRLKAHQTTCPTANLVGTWPCKRSWERAALDSATQSSCKLIANEVFDCDNIEALIAHCKAFFAVMP